ncbi:MAG: hypothetical protein HC771_13395 [Synechococcales cyanobacterium CRU_2_2]|nr:hypothetical protein [Synechococcales cyanobacterium CRU_2_2]
MPHSARRSACLWVDSVGASILGLGLTGLTLVAMPAQGAMDPIQQLLSTKQCSGCNLERAGLVLSNLEGAQLASANLRAANLGRASLQNANLQNANLQGAVLYGANLVGADLRGADLRGADLRGAYLSQAKFEGARLENANLQGAIAIPSQLVSTETYYAWAVSAAQQGRHPAAIEHYTQVIARDGSMAAAYLGRGLSASTMGQLEGAIKDLNQAKQLFAAAQDPASVALVEQSITALTEEPKLEGDNSGNFFVKLFQTVVPLMLKFVL